MSQAANWGIWPLLEIQQPTAPAFAMLTTFQDPGTTYWTQSHHSDDTNSVPTSRGLPLGKPSKVTEVFLGSAHHTDLAGSWNYLD